MKIFCFAFFFLFSWLTILLVNYYNIIILITLSYESLIRLNMLHKFVYYISTWMPFSWLYVLLLLGDLDGVVAIILYWGDLGRAQESLLVPIWFLGQGSGMRTLQKHLAFILTAKSWNLASAPALPAWADDRDLPSHAESPVPLESHP